MSNKLFTEQELELLRKNPYVKKVSSKSITYTEEFREFFVNMYNLSKKPTEIFIIAGFDPKMLGYQRIKQASERFRAMEKRIDGLKDMRSENSGRLLERELSDDEKIAKLENENKKLRQELEFLKKMEFLVRQAKFNKSRQ